jgi:hypothetical protein
MYTDIDDRLSTVEAALAEFIIQTNKSMHILQKEMREFKDESRSETREMKKQWGELANKMGTLVEDIIAPATGHVMEQFFKEEILTLSVNNRKYDKKTGLRGEFDIIATSSSYVYLVETKSNPKKEYLLEFKNTVIPRFQTLFPEFNKLKLIPVFASLRFEEPFIEFATQEGIYLMAYREWDYMDLLNFEALSKP